MIKKTVVVLLLLQISICFDYYLIRHGARGALSVNFPKIFGVQMQQLTPPGRSQAFFYGKQLRRRHPDILQKDMIVQSTNVDRTKQTAEYFLKGWYNLKGQTQANHSYLGTPSKPFVANPRFLPPIRLSYKPQVITHMVQKATHSSQIKMIPHIVKHMGRPMVQEPPTKDDVEWEQKIQKTAVCSIVDKFAPGVSMCKRSSPLSSYFYISDLITCMQYQGDNIPGLTQEQINQIHIATDIRYGRRYGRNAAPENYIINFFAVFNKYYSNNVTKLVLEFTHDTILFGMIRNLLGYQAFKKIFTPHIVCPFMSTIRFRVRNEQVRMFYNDRELQLTKCFEDGQSICSIRRFIKLIY